MNKTNKNLILALTLLATLATTARAEGDVCFRVQDECKSAAQLKEAGVVGVRFAALSLQRDDESTAWGLFAYKAGTPVQTVFPVTGVIPENIQGEDTVLASQGRICEALKAAAIGCSRDLLAGTWYTYALPNGLPPFTATFTPKSETPLAASGEFSTRRWACRKGDDADAQELEVSCKGNYYTSLRLLYLANAPYLTLNEVSCKESGNARPATFAAANLPACAEDGAQTDAYKAQDWLPLPATGLRYVSSNAARIYLQPIGVSFYRTGL